MAQCIFGFVKLAVGDKKPQDADIEEHTAFLPTSTEVLTQHHQATYSADGYRYSRDSGHFTASEASRSQSISSMQDHENEEHQKFLQYQIPHADTDAEYMEKQGFLDNTKTQRFASLLAAIMSQRAMRALTFVYNVIDCVSLPLGFTAIVSGAVVYAGVFVSYDHYFHPGHVRVDTHLARRKCV